MTNNDETPGLPRQAANEMRPASQGGPPGTALPQTLPVCLTIAGSDSGGGAGIQADLKTFHANAVFGISVLTAVTAQNTRAVTAAEDLSIPIIRAQLAAVFEDFPIAAMKTGMLSSAEIVAAIVRFLSERPPRPPLVVDPVMISKSGYALLAPDAVAAIRRQLLPLATLVTPNRHETELLAERPVREPVSRHMHRPATPRSCRHVYICSGRGRRSAGPCRAHRQATSSATWSLPGSGTRRATRRCSGIARGTPPRRGRIRRR